MAYVSVRNQNLSEVAAADRGKQFLIRLKEVLVIAGWSLIGTGDGTANVSVNLSGGATDYFPTFPSVTGVGADAWFAIKSADGAILVFQVNSSGYVAMHWSPTGAYTDDSPTHSVRLGGTTPPADEISLPTTYNAFCGAATGQKVSIIYDDGATGFVVFGAAGVNQPIGGFFLKLTGYKTGDTTPYVAWWYARNAFDSWEVAQLSANTGYMVGWHPSGAKKNYSFGQLEWNGTNLVAALPADPVSSDEQLFDVLLACHEASFYQVRGVVPGIKWMSGLRSSGDTFLTNRFMGMGRVVIDGWNSADALGS
jgi:hypothetical protein